MSEGLEFIKQTAAAMSAARWEPDACWHIACAALAPDASADAISGPLAGKDGLGAPTTPPDQETGLEPQENRPTRDPIFERES